MAAARSSASVVSFFFQAEDGIRDLTVTGVQTCALPISATPLRLHLDARRREANQDGAVQIGAQDLRPRRAIAVQNFPVRMAEAVAVSDRHHRPALAPCLDEFSGCAAAMPAAHPRQETCWFE